MAIDPIWFIVGAYAAGAIVLAVLIVRYFGK